MQHSLGTLRLATSLFQHSHTPLSYVYCKWIGSFHHIHQKNSVSSIRVSRTLVTRSSAIYLGIRWPSRLSILYIHNIASPDKRNTRPENESQLIRGPLFANYKRQEKFLVTPAKVSWVPTREQRRTKREPSASPSLISGPRVFRSLFFFLVKLFWLLLRPHFENRCAAAGVYLHFIRGGPMEFVGRYQDSRARNGWHWGETIPNREYFGAKWFFWGLTNFFLIFHGMKIGKMRRKHDMIPSICIFIRLL